MLVVVRIISARRSQCPLVSELAVSFICPLNQTHQFAPIVDEVTTAIFSASKQFYAAGFDNALTCTHIKFQYGCLY